MADAARLLGHFQGNTGPPALWSLSPEIGAGFTEVARLAVLFHPFTGSSELSRPARHHHKSHKQNGTLRFEGVTLQMPKAFREECVAKGLRPSEIILADKESLAILRDLAAKAKGLA